MLSNDINNKSKYSKTVDIYIYILLPYIYIYTVHTNAMNDKHGDRKGKEEHSVGVKQAFDVSIVLQASKIKHTTLPKPTPSLEITIETK